MKKLIMVFGLLCTALCSMPVDAARYAPVEMFSEESASDDESTPAQDRQSGCLSCVKRVWKKSQCAVYTLLGLGCIVTASVLLAKYGHPCVSMSPRGVPIYNSYCNSTAS